MRPLALALCVALAASAASAQELDVDAREVRPRPRRPALATDAHETGVEEQTRGVFSSSRAQTRPSTHAPPPRRLLVLPQTPLPQEEKKPCASGRMGDQMDLPSGFSFRVVSRGDASDDWFGRLGRGESPAFDDDDALLSSLAATAFPGARGVSPLDALFAPFGTPTYATSPDGARELSLRPPADVLRRIYFQSPPRRAMMPRATTTTTFVVRGSDGADVDDLVRFAVNEAEAAMDALENDPRGGGVRVRYVPRDDAGDGEDAAFVAGAGGDDASATTAAPGSFLESLSPWTRFATTGAGSVALIAAVVSLAFAALLACSPRCRRGSSDLQLACCDDAEEDELRPLTVAEVSAATPLRYDFEETKKTKDGYERGVESDDGEELIVIRPMSPEPMRK